MTPQQIDAMKLALEALTNAIAVRNGEGGTKLVSPLEENAITALEEALADHAMREVQRLGQEIEQEPVAWMKASDTEWSISFFEEDGYIPLYTAPPQRKPLTDEEIAILWKATPKLVGVYSYTDIAKEVEAAHGIKENT